MGGLFKKPKVPDPPKPVEMPDPEGMDARKARMKAMLDARRRQGRASTNLSGDDPYSGSTLGSP